MYVIVLSFKDYALYRLFTIIISKRGAPDGASLQNAPTPRFPHPLWSQPSVFPVPGFFRDTGISEIPGFALKGGRLMDMQYVCACSRPRGVQYACAIHFQCASGGGGAESSESAHDQGAETLKLQLRKKLGLPPVRQPRVWVKIILHVDFSRRTCLRGKNAGEHLPCAGGQSIIMSPE
jgi:hypothetical protein